MGHAQGVKTDNFGIKYIEGYSTHEHKYEVKNDKQGQLIGHLCVEHLCFKTGYNHWKPLDHCSPLDTIACKERVSIYSNTKKVLNQISSIETSLKETLTAQLSGEPITNLTNIINSLQEKIQKLEERIQTLETKN